MVTSEKYGQEEVEYDSPDESGVSVVFSEPAVLKVVFEEEREPLAERFQLALERVSESRGRHRVIAERFEEEGAVRFGALQPGEYEIVLHCRSSADDEYPVARLPYQVSAGENEVALSLPSLYALEIAVPGAQPDGKLQLMSTESEDSNWSLIQLLNSDRGVRIADLPAGRYRISLLDDLSAGEMVVSVPDSTAVTFQSQSEP